MFFLNVDYSVYVIKIALFRISLFLGHLDANIKIRKLFLGLNKVFFQKKKVRKERYAARGRHFSPSLPGDRSPGPNLEEFC